jgi:hypothetical protein
MPVISAPLPRITIAKSPTPAMVPVQLELTVYVPGTEVAEVMSPLWLDVKLVLQFPTPSNVAIPAAATGALLFPSVNVLGGGVAQPKKVTA